MDYIKNIHVINVNALPIIPLDERLVISVNARVEMEKAMRKELEDHPPKCIVGSMSQVNKRIAKVDVGLHLLDSRLAIEEYELEKKELREKSRGSPGDKAKRPEENLICRDTEFRNINLSLNKRKTADKNLLAELYQPPPFDKNKPNVLPNKVNFCDMVGNVVRAEKNPYSGKSYCSGRELEKFLSSRSPKTIWLDSFWWIFHERYQPNKEIQNKLFDRIARHYASILFLVPRTHYEEALIKRLPSLLSKALYTSFCCCFPQSWFNTQEFKSEICNTLNLWISGTYPCPQSYNSWDYSELDPERFRREELILQRSRLIKGREFTLFTCKQSSISKPDYIKKTHSPKPVAANSADGKSPERKLNIDDARQFLNPVKDQPCHILVSRKPTQRVKRISEARACVRMFLKKSHPVCKSPVMTENLFNIYGKSPLIVYFLLNYSTLHQQGQDVLVVRKENTTVIPDSVPTYMNIISLTLKNMQRRKNKLHQLIRVHGNEWKYFNNYLQELRVNFERDLANYRKKEAEKKRANHLFVPCSSYFEQASEKKGRRSPLREIALLSRKEKTEKGEKSKFLLSPFSWRKPEDAYSLGVLSPSKLGPISATRRYITKNLRTTYKEELMLSLSSSSLENNSSWNQDACSVVRSNRKQKQQQSEITP